jgi:molybdenum cofactor cytidylyltransferase
MSEKTQRRTISAIVLAAGISKRMGATKQLLGLRGSTLLEHTLNRVRESSVAEIILVLGFAAGQIQQQIFSNGLKLVINQAYQEGMASSLQAGIAAVSPEAEAALIVLGDQPLVRPATLDRLIEHYQRFKPEIVIPTYRGFRGNPVLLSRTVFPELMRLTGDVGCRAIFGRHAENILKVAVEDAGILLDVDSREDFQKLEKAANEAEAETALLRTADLEGRQTELSDIALANPELVVVGRDPVVATLLKLGRLLHFTTTLVDPLMTPEEAPDAERILHVLDFSRLEQKRERYVVVASRGQFDEDALEQALSCNATYVALLASQRRTDELLANLERRGVPPQQLAELRAPAGLNIGAESAEEIALSIMAEIIAQRRQQRSATEASART